MESVVSKITDYSVESVVSKIVDYSVAPIWRSIGYLFYYHGNMKTLEAEVENLGDIKTGVQLSVNAAKRNGEVIGPEVERWLTAVNGLIGEVKTFLEGEVEINNRGWWFPDPISRYSLSRKAKKKTQDVTEFKGKGSFQRVSYPAPPLGIENMATGCFTDFESRKLTMDEIMAALKDDNINAIGICGLGGMGKTTAVKEVGKRAKVEKLFDEIVMAVVTQTPNLIVTQDEIAEQLGLELKENSLSVRAAKLRKSLLDCGRVLVILDDVWKTLKLEEIGIPLGGDHKCCKVMLTSRNQDVCNGMNTCENFTIGVLLEEEQWNLFKEMAGKSIESPDLHQIATEVVKECGGLPIAIVTVGMALKDKPKARWNDALVQLKQYSPENIPEMNEKVYRSLELSFNFLESQEAKSCLLLCCIFKEDADIPLQDLIRYGVGLCLFKVEDLVQATDRVHSLVETLKSCYLLLGSEKEECVKMHDVVRDVIRSIATAGEDGLMLRHGLELKEWPTESADQLYTSTSFMSNNIQDLLLLELKKWPTAESTAQYYPLLSNKMNGILSLERIGDSVQVPENLFEGMKEVRVLQLRRMFIPSPPPSLALLTKLQTLCIEDCNLKNISLIGELKTLKILSFRGSSIQELPMQTGKLTHLRSLDLTECTRLERISPGVLSSLIRLEQLYMINCHRVRWEVEEGTSERNNVMRKCGVRWEVEEGTSERNNVNVAELKSLSDKLTALEIELPASSTKFLGGFKKLVRFFIRIGDTSQLWFENEHVQNELIINLDSGNSVESWINDQLLKKTEILHFEVCSVKNVLNNLNRESLVQLKTLHLSNCDELEYVIETVDLIQQSIFPILDTLNIFRAHNLKMICHGQLPAGSFAELREIYLFNCERLEYVFSESIARGLVQLEKMNIMHCKMMEEIVVTEREHEEVSSEIRFPKLRAIAFYQLPSLVGFCKKMGDEIEFPQLSKLDLVGLPKLRSIWPSSLGTHESDDSATLLNEKVSFPRLESLTVSHMENFGEMWCSQPPSCSLYELRELNVSNCHKILHVAPFHLLKRLQNLEEVCVECCDSVEEVFEFIGPSVEEGHAVMLSRLKRMILKYLPKLMHILKEDHNRTIGFQNLKELKVWNCDSLRNLFDPSVTRGLVHLESLDVGGCVMMEEIVAKGEEQEEGRMDKIVIPKLKVLTLWDLQNLTSFCQDLYAFDLPLLDVVIVQDCPKMKTFSSGFASAPKLKQVYDLENLMGDLNKTIQQLFQRQASEFEWMECNSEETDDVERIHHKRKRAEEEDMRPIRQFSR